MKAGSVDFTEIAENLDNPHQYGNYLVACCPFHDDSKPSFMVYQDTYKCLSCGAFGQTNKLLERLGKVVRTPNPYRGEPLGSPNPFSKWMKDKTLKKTLWVAWETINQNLGLGNYITHDRGIDEKYRKLLGIGYIDDWYTIPMRDRNGIIIGAIARKGRDNSSISKYVLPHGTNPNLLYIPNQTRIKNAPFLIVTFGILDAVVLAIMGYPAASTISGKHLSPVAVASYRLPIFIIPDQHEEADGMISAQGLGWRGYTLKIDWPERCKDVNEVWVKDRQLCRELITGALEKHGATRG
jgi:hypothetical protein